MRIDLVEAITRRPTHRRQPGQAALVIARVEYPRLDPEPYLAMLDAMGDAARKHIEAHSECSGSATPSVCVQALNRYLFDELGFVGNRKQYEDPRNSCLNEVLERRTGIPITMSVVYMEVARRAGSASTASTSPATSCALLRGQTAPGAGLIIDPFHGGALLTEQTAACCCSGTSATKWRSASRCSRRRRGRR
jgi:regulator of sirC expression with transglutaminase-like and TPR domain